MPAIAVKYNVILIVAFNLNDLSTYSAIAHDVRMRRMIYDSDVLLHIAASNRFKGINIDSGMKLELEEVDKENVERRMKSFFLPDLIGRKNKR